MKKASKSKELLLNAVERLSPNSDRDFLEEYWDNPASRNAPTAVSRQARHARVARARRIAVIGSLLSAANDRAYETLCYSTEFLSMRPLSAEYNSTFYHLLLNEEQTCLPAAERLWEIGLPHFFRSAHRIEQATLPELLEVQSALAMLYAGPMARGTFFADAWKDLHKEATRRGLLANRYLHMQLAIMGTYAGDCGPHIDWLLDKKNREFDLADTYLFVRRDSPDDLFRHTATLIRGESVALDSCLSTRRPATSLRQLGSYLKMCMRNTNHFSNEGQVLMLLSYVEHLWEQATEMRSDSQFRAEAQRLFSVLGQIEQIEILEKSRFWRIFEKMDASPARQELGRLWQQSLSGEPVE